ncbi:glycosyltransferase family 4 protein [Thiovibrio sp. JS02]
MHEQLSHRVLFLSYHLPMAGEPGAFRPWMEARLLRLAGLDVTVVTSGVQYMTGKDIRPSRGWCTEEYIDGVRILRTWAPSDHRSSYVRRLFNYATYTVLAGVVSVFRVGRVFSVFAGTDPIVMMPMVYLVAKLKKARLVLDERDLFPETAVALGALREGILTRLLFSLQQYFRRRAIRLVAATPGISDRLIAYGHPEEKIRLVYNADAFLDHDMAENGDIGVVDLRSMTGKAFLVGYAGGLGLANDLQTLMNAVPLLRDIDDFGVVILGEGEKRPQYEEFCRENNLSCVHFLGAVPRQRARLLVRQFDVCVQPLPPDKHFSHTLTSKTFDYHGLGRAMIFCGQGDTVKLLQESGGGMVVGSRDDEALAEAIRSLYHDVEKRKKMGESARHWFIANVSVDRASAILREVISGA